MAQPAALEAHPLPGGRRVGWRQRRRCVGQGVDGNALGGKIAFFTAWPGCHASVHLSTKMLLLASEQALLPPACLLAASRLHPPTAAAQ